MSNPFELSHHATSPATKSGRFMEVRSAVESTPALTKSFGSTVELHFSGAEQQRYMSNAVFGEALQDSLTHLFDSGFSPSVEELDQKMDEIGTELNTSQRKILTGSMHRMKEAIQSVSPEYRVRCQSLAQTFYEGLAGSVEELGGFPPEIEITSLGAVMIRVQDLGAWRRICDFQGFEPGLAGIKILSPEGQSAVSDDDAKDFGRMIVLAPEYITHMGGESSDAFAKHELFHDVYHLAIAPEQTVSYRDPFEKEVFISVKNELLAYLIGNSRWNSNLNDTAGSVIVRETLDPQLQNRRPEEIIAFASYSSRLQREGATPEQARERTRQFSNELFSAMHAITKLALLQDRSFEQGVSRLLVSQSFKEIAFHASELSGEREVVAEDLLKDSETQEPASFAYIIEALSNAVRFSIPIQSLEAVLVLVEQAIDQFRGYDSRDVPPQILQLQRLAQLARESVMKPQHEKNAQANALSNKAMDEGQGVL
ncbi:hypothetical protein IPH19_05415 [Candidatus Uhrbacteria bacterium]|nr:MAG: hypothetical protein IPH19_05415 [Candidatus Uhrbacteria bacterium]